MKLEQALTIVKAAGYRVSKPRKRVTALGLNAVGEPYSPNYDPAYKLRTPLTSIRRLSHSDDLHVLQWSERSRVFDALVAVRICNIEKLSYQ